MNVSKPVMIQAEETSMQRAPIHLKEYFTDEAQARLSRTFHSPLNRIDALQHPLDPSRRLLWVTFAAALNQASALCVYLNTTFFKGQPFFATDVPNLTPDRFATPFHPTLCSFVGNQGAMCDLFISFKPESSDEFARSLEDQSADIDFITDNPDIVFIMKKAVEFEAAKRRLLPAHVRHYATASAG